MLRQFFYNQFPLESSRLFPIIRLFLFFILLWLTSLLWHKASPLKKPPRSLRSSLQEHVIWHSNDRSRSDRDDKSSSRRLSERDSLSSSETRWWWSSKIIWLSVSWRQKIDHRWWSTFVMKNYRLLHNSFLYTLWLFTVWKKYWVSL